jgi:hypothetical protein
MLGDDALVWRLGLANTTFRRNFPHIAADLRHHRTASPASADATTRFDQLKLDNDKLRRGNHELREHLDLAAAALPRLTIENHQLHHQLEALTKVARIDSTHRRL